MGRGEREAKGGAIVAPAVRTVPEEGDRRGGLRRAFPWINVLVLGATLASFALSVVHTVRATTELDAEAVAIGSNATPAIEHLSRARGELLHLQLDIARAAERAEAGAPLDRARFDATLGRLDGELRAYLDIPFLPHEGRLVRSAEVALRQLEEDVRVELRELSEGDARAAARVRRGALRPAVARADDALAELVTFNAREQRRLSASIRAEQLRASEVGYVLYGMSLVLALVLLLLVVRQGKQHAVLLGREKDSAERRARDHAAFSARLQALASSSVAISDTITESTDLHAMLRSIAEQARAIVRAASCSVRLDAGEGAEPRVLSSPDGPTPEGGPALTVPIPNGELVLVRASGGPGFSRDDARVAELFAAQAGVAIENARLYREAQRASRAREDVLASVSHDLRNPLNAIHLAAEVLRVEPGVSVEAARVIDRIERSVDRMNRLVRDLLDAAQIDAGRLRAEPRPEALRTIVEDVVDGFTGAAREKCVRLATEVPALAVLCERDLVLRVLSNLIGNALKFTPAEGRIAVSAVERGEEVEIAVADTGPGIPADAMEHLFARYWQRGADRRGSGLGLYIARGIVEAHGGRIWVESELGAGTTFRFTLPRA